MNDGAALLATSPATLPPRDLPGLDPSWSRLVDTVGDDGARHSWHILDTGPPQPVGTLLCVHGNPTWSYLWRSIIAAASSGESGWRVIAVDQLGMGFSERTPQVRRLRQRIDDLSRLTDALALQGPVITVAHDWGGPISLGWALEHRELLAGVVLTNTAVNPPASTKAPALIRAVRNPGVLRTATVRTPAFLRGTLRLAHPQLPSAVRRGYLSPYADSLHRQAIGDFVDDIPLRPDHPSWSALTDVRDRLGELADVPALMLWGPRDPVFSDADLDDLQRRLPHAQVHRFEGAGHLVVEDAPVAAAVVEWIGDDRIGSAVAQRFVRPPDARRPLWSALEKRSADAAAAVVEMDDDGVDRSISFADLAQRVRDLAAGLVAEGVRPGERVALLIPPGIDLTTVVYACWRAGAVVVVADAGLGLRSLGRALRGARPDHIVGTATGLAAARAMRVPGRRIATSRLPKAAGSALGIRITVSELAERGRGLPDPVAPADDAPAAVLFTSGATGPAKGVVYSHRQLEAQRDLVAEAYAVEPTDRLVAAFAPFALYGPALGITSVVPAMNVTKPGPLRAVTLADACAAVDATMVFASPAALGGVLASADALSDAQRQALRSVRLLLSAGAPVPVDVLRRSAQLLGDAEAHTPYGMTEALPVADITLEGIEAAGEGDGVCVGRPLAGVDVALLPLDAFGDPTTVRTDQPWVTGEICVEGPQLKTRYDRLWLTQHHSESVDGWHRTGDVGHLDDKGRLWVEGRLAHVITTPAGPLTPVGVEQRVESLADVKAAAAVGVGPKGTQQLVLVVVPSGEAPSRSGDQADDLLRERIRRVSEHPVSAVLVVARLPVDIRHNSKVDRQALATWASAVLAGRRARRP